MTHVNMKLQLFQVFQRRGRGRGSERDAAQWIERLPRMLKALGSIPSTAEKNSVLLCPVSSPAEVTVAQFMSV